jgi:hypothetical protein
VINVDHFCVIDEPATGLDFFGIGDKFSFVPFLINNNVIRCDVLDDNDVSELKSQHDDSGSISLTLSRLRKEGIGSIIRHTERLAKDCGFSQSEISDFRSSEILIYQSPLDMGALPLESDPYKVDDEYLAWLRNAPYEDFLIELLRRSETMQEWGYAFEIFVSRFGLSIEVAKAAIAFIARAVTEEYQIDRLNKLMFRKIIHLYIESEAEISHEGADIIESIESDLLDVISIIEEDDLLAVMCDGDAGVAIETFNVLNTVRPERDIIQCALNLLSPNKKELVNQSRERERERERESVLNWKKELKRYMVDLVYSLDSFDEVRAVNLTVGAYLGSVEGRRRDVISIDDINSLKKYVIGRINLHSPDDRLVAIEAAPTARL